MKIAFIIQNYNYHGGAQKTASIAYYLQSIGHNVDIIVIRCDDADLESRPSQFSNVIDLNASSLFSSIYELSKIFRNSEYDVFICIGGYSNLAAGLAKFLTRCSAPIIGSENFAKSVLIGDYTKFFLRFSLPLFRFAYTQLNGLLFVSDSLRSEFLKKNSWHPSRCITIYNPVLSSKKKLKKIINQKVSGTTFLGVGVLEPRKRFDLLLKSFSIIALSNPNDKLLIAGTGSQKQKLKLQAKKLGIETQVNFLGFVDDVDSLMQSSDILVLTSNSEAFGMVLIEGLSAGLQIVSTNSFSGPAEVLGNGRYGYLANVDDIDSIVSAIKTIKEKPIDDEIIQEGASRFQVDQISNKYLEFIANIMMDEGNIYEAI
ncbi:glycosyltransferase [Pelagibacterales bacterium SAG-MED34]|nr:glycosyltransferase [Pelagibacterales bacterium SAG-MED34]